MMVEESTSDNEIIIYITKKDKEYFSYIIDRYEYKLRCYLNRLTNYSDEVDDLLQQTFINTFVNLNSFDLDKKFSSWIYRIAHNLTINWLKKKKASISIDENEIISSKLSSKIDLIKEYENQEFACAISKGINKLPEKFKEPFILKYFENKTYEEISDIIMKPKNTVGTMINRAKNKLQQSLKLYEKECKK